MTHNGQIWKMKIKLVEIEKSECMYPLATMCAQGAQIPYIDIWQLYPFFYHVRLERTVKGSHMLPCALRVHRMNIPSRYHVRSGRTS